MATKTPTTASTRVADRRTTKLFDDLYKAELDYRFVREYRRTAPGRYTDSDEAAFLTARDTARDAVVAHEREERAKTLDLLAQAHRDTDAGAHYSHAAAVIRGTATPD